MTDLNSHWNRVYREKTDAALSWHQAGATASLALIDSLRTVLGEGDSPSVLEGALLVIGRLTGLGRAPELALAKSERGRIAEALSAERARPARERGDILAATAIALLNGRAGVSASMALRPSTPTSPGWALFQR